MTENQAAAAAAAGKVPERTLSQERESAERRAQRERATAQPCSVAVVVGISLAAAGALRLRHCARQFELSAPNMLTTPD